MSEGHFYSITVSPRGEVCLCDALFSLAIGSPCQIRLAHVGSPSDIRQCLEHQTLSGDDVNICILLNMYSYVFSDVQ